MLAYAENPIFSQSTSRPEAGLLYLIFPKPTIKACYILGFPSEL